MKNRTIGIAALALAALWPGLAQPATAKVPPRDVSCRVELDRGVLPADTKVTAVIKVTLDAPAPPERKDRPPVNLGLVLDRSGSMTGDKIERAREAAIEAVRRLGAQDMVSLVIYDHEVETLVPAQSAANSEWIEGRIRGITSRGNTALYGGVSQGAAEVRKNAGGKYVSRLLLLSDGLANVGPSSPADLGRLGASLLKEGISVTTVGVGTDYNEDLMTQLAQNSDGNTYFVENSADLPRIFAAELGDVLSVVAREVKVEIECEDGVRPIRIIGRDGTISGNRASLYLNQLYGGQAKYALLEVELAPTANNQERAVASARVNYDNALTRVRATASASARARFSRSEEDVKRSANAPVQRDWMFNVAAEANDQSISLSDQGRRREAAAVLRQNADQLQAAGRELKEESLVKKAAELEAQAAAVETRGYDNRSRKAAVADSYQTKNQQLNQ